MDDKRREWLNIISSAQEDKRNNRDKSHDSAMRGIRRERGVYTDAGRGIRRGTQKANTRGI